MFRLDFVHVVCFLGSPHTRGDVPELRCVIQAKATFSPHAWGCSDSGAGRPTHTSVLPTRVGMFRDMTDGNTSTGRSPHTRGDVPTNADYQKKLLKFSPHAWGCSDAAERDGDRDGVLPTRVGMFR